MTTEIQNTLSKPSNFLYADKILKFWNRYSLYIMTALCVLVAMASIRFIFLELSEANPGLIDHTDNRPWSFYLHVAGASTALLFGPWQFFAEIRNKFLKVHRYMGIIYIISCLIGGVTGIHIGYFSPSGSVAAAGFITLGILWLTTTGLGLFNILKRDIQNHRRWMIRSFALTFSAVTLRLYIPPMFTYGMDTALIFSIVAWICWIPNLIIANKYIIPAKTP